MSIPSAPGTTIACALLLALSCAACTRPPPPPPEQPPEPQAHAALREEMQAPSHRAKVAGSEVQGAAAKRKAAIAPARG